MEMASRIGSGPSDGWRNSVVGPKQLAGCQLIQPFHHRVDRQDDDLIGKVVSREPDHFTGIFRLHVAKDPVVLVVVCGDTRKGGRLMYSSYHGLSAVARRELEKHLWNGLIPRCVSGENGDRFETTVNAGTV